MKVFNITLLDTIIQGVRRRNGSGPTILKLISTTMLKLLRKRLWKEKLIGSREICVSCCQLCLCQWCIYPSKCVLWMWYHWDCWNWNSEGDITVGIGFEGYWWSILCIVDMSLYVILKLNFSRRITLGHNINFVNLTQALDKNSRKKSWYWW